VWYDIYRFYQRFAGAKIPDYKDISPKFIEACNVYENQINKYKSEK